MTLSGPAAAGLAALLVVLLALVVLLLVRSRGAAARVARLTADAEVTRAEVEVAQREAATVRAGAAQTSTIVHLAREIATGEDGVESTAAALCSSLQRVLGGECVVHMLSPDAQLLRRVAATGAPSETSAHAGLAGYVLHTRKRVSFSGAPPAELPASDEERSAHAAHPDVTVTLVPLLHRDRGLGLVELRRPASRVTAGDEPLLDAVAELAGATLARLLEREGLRGELVERRRAEEAQAQAAAELRETVRLKDEFMATVAHELRTPLNAIIGWSHILKTGAVDDTTRAKALEAVIRNGDRQSRLIGDLLDLSRVTAGKLELELQGVVELAPVVRAAIDTVRPAADAKGVHVRSVVDAEAGPLTADPHRLQQVIWNLLVNAVKFTPQGGEVSVVVERAGADVEIKIADTGPGVPEDLLAHVFDRFRQGSASARVHGGLGLGLAIVRHLVELHGGEVSVRNNHPQRGATFVVRLPPRAPSPAPGAPAAAAPSDERLLPSLEGLRVLVVDDEVETRELLASILRERGAEADTASTTAEALAKVRSACPDIVIADLDLGGEDGCALVRQLRTLPASEGGAVTAVAVTGHARPEDRIQALLAGFQGHVAKPADPAELVALVASLTDRNRVPAAV